MSPLEHYAYPEEAERLQFTLKQVEKSLVTTRDKLVVVGKEVERAKRSYKSDNSQDYIDLMISTNIQSSLELKLRNLKTASSKPYFARIDFQEKDQPVERLYLGKMSLTKDEDQSLVIIDWRAPVANLYYEGRLGETSYHCPDGEINGELQLKRQLSIDDGELRAIFDIDITTNDQFLQSYLGASADHRLKEIVATIQSEQNRIIRAEMSTPLIVQGVAGSGKTTVALHRIAYLIYNYEEEFSPENFMIIAPNRLFLNYISEVLPELGVEKVKQITFEDFAREIIGGKIKVREANERLVAFVRAAGETANLPEGEAGDGAPIISSALLKEVAAVKSSLYFKDLLDRYIAHISQNMLPATDFACEGWTIYTKAEIKRLFHHDYGYWPVYRRLEQIKKHLRKRLNDRLAEEITKLQEACNLQVWQVKEAMEESEVRRKFILQLIAEKDRKIERLQEFNRCGVKEYGRQFSVKNSFQHFLEFMANPEFFFSYAMELPVLLRREIINQTTYSLRRNRLEMEDLAPLMYLQYRLFGLDEKVRVKHIVIDEAQDFSLFQFYVLKHMIKDSSFTILGDLSQGIHSYRGIRDWEALRETVFAEEECKFLSLEQSYRNTVEIMEAANYVLEKIRLPGLVKAQPVIRHGAPVQIIRKKNQAEIAASLKAKIEEAQHNGYQSVAVICKTPAEVNNYRELLAGLGCKANLITGKEKVYRGGVVIVPVWLAKGLEFDVVIIAGAGLEQYSEEELEIKLLYVAITRALHRLYIYYTGALTPVLAGFNKGVYS